MHLLVVFVAILFLATWNNPASPKDGVDWDAVPTSPEVKKWFRELMQPDNPSVSCCGEADAYYADSFAVDGDKYVAIITDKRPPCDGTQKALEDGCVSGRPHIAPGTRIVVPNNKLKYDSGNPTGHGILFVAPQPDSAPDGYAVYCYIVPGGV